MAIPWADIYTDITSNATRAKTTEAPKPKIGSELFANLFRIERETENAEMSAVSWSSPHAPDFHKLSRFGRILLGNSLAIVPNQNTETK